MSSTNAIGLTASAANSSYSWNSPNWNSAISNMDLGSTGNTTFGLSNETWGGIGAGIGLAANAWNAYNSYSAMKDQKEAYDNAYSLALAEYDMAKDAYDRNVARSESIGSQMREETA